MATYIKNGDTLLTLIRSWLSLPDGYENAIVGVKVNKDKLIIRKISDRDPSEKIFVTNNGKLYVAGILKNKPALVEVKQLDGGTIEVSIKKTE